MFSPTRKNKKLKKLRIITVKISNNKYKCQLAGVFLDQNLRLSTSYEIPYYIKDDSKNYVTMFHYNKHVFLSPYFLKMLHNNMMSCRKNYLVSIFNYLIKAQYLLFPSNNCLMFITSWRKFYISTIQWLKCIWMFHRYLYCHPNYNKFWLIMSNNQNFHIITVVRGRIYVIP